MSFYQENDNTYVIYYLICIYRKRMISLYLHITTTRRLLCIQKRQCDRYPWEKHAQRGRFTQRKEQVVYLVSKTNNDMKRHFVSSMSFFVFIISRLFDS